MIKPKSELLPQYFEYFFKSSVVDEQISLGSKKTSVTNLHLDKIRELKIVLPSISEQMVICRYLDGKVGRINNLIKETEESIQLLREHRTALISAAVTGKIDVREAV